MIKKEFNSLLKSKGLIITMAIVLLVPILYAGTFLKAVWNPYNNTGNMKVGVVNLDKKVDLDGKTLEVGNSMVEKLKENKKVNWQFVDKDTAERELREGDYYMVVTIPENFSKNASSLSNENPEKMNIDFTTNFTKSKNGEKIMETVASNLTNTVKDQVVKTYTATLYSKFSELGSSLQKAADATNQLNNGLGRLSEGGQKLSNGVDQLQAGAGKLSNGLSTLNDKKNALISGVNELAAGSDKLTIGFDTFKTKSIMLTEGLEKLHNGSQAFKEGLLKYTNGVLTLNEKLLAKKGDLEKLSAGSTTLNNSIDRLSDGISQINSGLAAKQDDLNRLSAGGNALKEGVDKLSESAPKLVDGAGKITDGLNALNAGLPSERDLAAKKSNLNSTLDKIKGLKLTYRTHFNPLNTAFTELGAQLEAIKGLIDSIDTQTTTTTTTVAATPAPTSAPTPTTFTNLEQALASMDLKPEQKASILAAARNDAAASASAQPTVATPQPTTTVQPNTTANNNNSQVKAKLTSALSSANSKYSSMKYRVGRLNYIQTQLDKFDVNELSTKLAESIDGFATIKTAVGQLAAGSGQLKAGLTVMNEKAPTLAAGFNQYKGGVDATVTSLTSGGALADGLNLLANATPQLKAGVTNYTSGVNALTTSMTTGELAQGVGTLASKGAELQSGFDRLAGGIGLIHEKLPELAGGIDALVNGNARINAGLNKLKEKLPELSIGIQELDNGGKKLYQGLTDMQAKAPELINGLNSAKEGADKLSNGLSSMKAKAPELINGLNSAKEGSEKLSNGLSSMKAKAPELINGLNSAKEGSEKLSSSLSTMKAKAPELINGLNSAKEGSDKLYSGLSIMHSKAPELLAGLDKAKDGSGLLAEKLSSGADKLSSAKTGDKNVDMMSNPIKTNIADISEETSYGNAMAPFFLVFGLLIAAAAYNILFPVRKQEYGESVNSLFGTRLASMATFAIFAVIIEVVAMSLFFDFKVQNFGMYFFGLIISAIVFMIITHFLSYTFGNVGHGISIGFVALQFVLTTPLFPKEMLPSLYSGMIPFTPVFYGDTAVRHAVLGGLTNGMYNSAILILVVLGIIFTTLTYISYNKNNKLTVNLAK